MGNAIRHERPNVLMHVIPKAVAEDRLFPNVSWMAEFEELFAIEASERQWDVWSYCLMGTHYHVVMSTPDCSLSAGMQRLHLRLAQRRNRETRGGRLMSGPYWAQTIQGNGHLASCLRYLPMNPVKAGLCADPADWRFGSYRSIVGLEDCPSWLVRDRVLGFAARTPDEFAQWVRASVRIPEPPMSQRDFNRFDIECRLLAGQRNREIAHALGVSVRSVERVAAKVRREGEATRSP